VITHWRSGDIHVLKGNMKLIVLNYGKTSGNIGTMQSSTTSKGPPRMVFNKEARTSHAWYKHNNETSKCVAIHKHRNMKRQEVIHIK